jgi:hypothetical protein
MKSSPNSASGADDCANAFQFVRTLEGRRTALRNVEVAAP